MKIKTQYNRLIVRLRRASDAFKNVIDSKMELDDVQKEAYKTCKKMICHPKAELIYAPITSTYYIEQGHYYIRLVDGSVTITNGKFSYYVWLPSTQTSELRLLFDRISQTKSNRLEKRYADTTLENLKGITNQIELENTKSLIIN